jgi:hypothetical protein
MNNTILPPQTKLFKPGESPESPIGSDFHYTPASNTPTNFSSFTVTGENDSSLALPENPVDDFSSSIATQPPIKSPTLRDPEKLDKLTCSLNLFYRSGSQGCVCRQIQVFSRSRYAALSTDASVAREALAQDASFIRNDMEFFGALQREYKHNMCGFWRRWLSMKTLRSIRLLTVCTIYITCNGTVGALILTKPLVQARRPT